MRGRADELAALLQDDTAERRGALDLAPQDQSGTLSPVQAQAALTRRVVATGEAIAAQTAPRPEFRAALRTRLLAVATVQAGTVQAGTESAPGTASAAGAHTGAGAGVRAVSWRTGGRASGILAGALASVVAVSGVAVAGSRSLPGDPLYGVKGATEALQLRLADGDVAKGTRHLDLAATRLSEVAGLTLGRDAVMSEGTARVAAPAGVGPRVVLASAGGPVAAGASQPLGPDVAERVQDTLDEMDEQTLQGQELLTAAFRDTRSPEPLQALTSFAARQSATIELWFSVLPDGALPERDLERARASLALVADVSDGATELLAPL